ncbi:peroxiredoxin family protein [Hydrogenophaga sp.]|uniref:peroxiredoxin family protein n=1 Tax=Hydrogenophaga sp. TaxID=1904254 RepID=UPI003F70137C
MNTTPNISPPLQVSQWLNSPKPVTLESLHGKVVVLQTFQMLCPGCVAHGLPQALRIHRLFPQDRVAVIGLHTVFEHHEVMGPQALRVFLDEYRIPFHVGVDQADPPSPLPLTMQAYGLRGTPSVVVFDAQGGVRLSHFGQIDDLQLGAVIGQLLAEAPSNATVDVAASVAKRSGSSTCAKGECVVDG